jgi:hypothetical protein
MFCVSRVVAALMKNASEQNIQFFSAASSQILRDILLDVDLEALSSWREIITSLHEP